MYSVGENNGVLKLENVEDIKVDEDETNRFTRVFKKELDARLTKMTKNRMQEGEGPDDRRTHVSDEEMSSLVKGALWKTFRLSWAIAAIFGIVGECTGIFSCYYISHLIQYLRDPDSTIETGIQRVVIFSIVNIIQGLCRNYYIHYGFMTSIRMRRTLVAVIFDKVINMSMKSLIATNSGKLIAVISSDLFAVERSLAFSPMILAFPFVNVFAYTVIGLTGSWVNALIVFGVQIIIFLVQFCSGKLAKILKLKDSASNDERLKLVSDMVVGVRTLKSYGWEQHYLKKITNVRKKQ